MKKTFIAFTVLFSFLFTSCYVNRTTVGYGPVGESLHTRTYAKAKQKYVVFGLIRINDVNLKAPPTGVGYEIKSGFTFVDGILTLITAGIYGQRTVKILVEKGVEQDLKQEQQNHTPKK